MESPSKTPKLVKITPKLVLQIAFPLILLTIIPLQLAKNIYFKSTPPPPTRSTSSSNIHDQIVSHKPLPSSTGPKCDIFSGEWVPNPGAPYYTNTSCWAIHEHQNCMKYGRPDTDFMKWKWKPDECELPLFNPRQFFEIVKGKSLAFIGDSVARNQMQSMICILSRVEWPYEVSITKDEHFTRWNYRSYNFTMAMFTSPFLVKAQENDPNGPTGTGLFGLHLDEADPAWKDQIDEFDYIILSAGHWFFRPLMYYEKNNLIGCRFCQKENVTDYSMAYGYRKAFRTAFRAIMDRKAFKGIVYLRTFAPSHFEGGEWNKGGNCVRQKPFKSNEINLQGVDLDLYMAQVGEFNSAQKLRRKDGPKLRLIDMTQPMLLRPDGHPSKYGHWPSENVVLANDCVHWCLPGPIDTWIDFLLEMMRNEGVISKQEKVLHYPFPDSSQFNATTIFVSNLPVNLDVFGFRGIFSRIGTVEDVSIPGNQGGSKRYGFVKFENQGDASRCIRIMNNKLVRGVRIWVQFAKREFSRVWRGHPNKSRHQPRSMPFSPGSSLAGAGVDSLLDSIKKCISVEVEKFAHVRKALAILLGKFEGLLVSKSFQSFIGEFAEVAENLRVATPSNTLAQSNSYPYQTSPLHSFKDVLTGERVVVSDSCNIAVVEDSLPHPKPAFNEIEEGEFQTIEPEVGAVGSIDVVEMETEVDPLSPASEFDSQPLSDQPCFSFKSKSKKRRKKVGKSRARRSQIHQRSGVKRKSECQGRTPALGGDKRVKRSEPPRQWQDGGVVNSEDVDLNPAEPADGVEVGDNSDPLESLDALFNELGEDVVASESLESLGSPGPSLSPAVARSKDCLASVSVSPVNLLDNFKDPELERSPGFPIRGNLSPSYNDSERRLARSPSSQSIDNLSTNSSESEKRLARKAIDFGRKVGVKVVGCPVGARNRITRTLKKNRRYHSPVSSISGTF